MIMMATPRKCLATYAQLRSKMWQSVMQEINEVARKSGFSEYLTYSRIWELPWIWLQLKHMEQSGLKVLGIGTQNSPMPWLLASKGFNVIVSDITPTYWRYWQRASRQLYKSCKRMLLDAQNLNVETANVDIYLSVSVIEHIKNKEKAIAEAARVLRTGGILIMTFDICETEMGMIFPEWNGQALTMSGCDNLFKDSQWFETGLLEIPWNTADINEYLSWHRTTAPHHNYVTGAILVQRNSQIWKEAAWKDVLRIFKRRINSAFFVQIWYIKYVFKIILTQNMRLIKFILRRAMSLIISPYTLLLGGTLFRILGMRRKKRKIDLSEVKHVLIIRTDGIGDVVLTMPFLRELRQNLTDAWITCVVTPSVYNLMKACPYVNEVLTFDNHVLGKFKQVILCFRAIKLAWGHLWHRHFDLAIIPRWDIDGYSASLCAYLSAASWRVAYSENVNRNKKRYNRGYDKLFTDIIDNRSAKHEVLHNLEIIKFLKGTIKDDRLELWFKDEDEDFVDKLLRANDVHHDELIIAFGIGAGTDYRKWPLENFVELGIWLKKEYKLRIVIIGGEKDELWGMELCEQLGDIIINAAGKTTLRQTVALLKQCRLFVGNDSGPMHLAAGVGMPVIEISCHPLNGSLLHPNSPKRFGPWRVPSYILQPEHPMSPCIDSCTVNHAHCIWKITTQEVKQAFKKIMNRMDMNLLTENQIFPEL